MVIVECTEGAYEAQQVRFGKVYKRCPENVMGSDYVAMFQERLPAERAKADEAIYAWRLERNCQGGSLPLKSIRYKGLRRRGGRFWN